MFEKEAEKYAENNAYKYASDYITCREAYKDGAEFGYNKCKEELNKIGLALQSDMDKTIKQNIALKKGIRNCPLKGDKRKIQEWSNNGYFKKNFLIPKINIKEYKHGRKNGTLQKISTK